MPKLFISYRRSDSAGQAGRLADQLRHLRPQLELFFDTSTLRPGAPWQAGIDQALQQCDVMLVVVGPAWLKALPDQPLSRLHQPGDLVAHEISVALQRGIKVVPVRVGGARLPSVAELPPALQGLLAGQEADIRDTSFDRDVAALADDLFGLTGPLVGAGGANGPGQSGAWRRAAAAMLGLVVLGGGAWQWWRPPTGDAAAPQPGPGAIHPPPAEALRSVNLDLRLALDPEVDENTASSKQLLLLQRLPLKRNPALLTKSPLAAQAAQAEYPVDNLDMPADGARFVADLLRTTLVSSKVTLKTRSTLVCFAPVSGARAAEPRVRLACDEGQRCRPADDDLKLVQSCPDSVAVLPRRVLPPWLLRLPLPAAMAAASAQPATALATAATPAGPLLDERPAPGDWLVPPLALMKARQGLADATAFSAVHLRSGPLAQTALAANPALLAADELSYRLTVNGHRVWVNGLPPWAYAQPFDARQGIDLEFGLENLDATGAQQGFETLTVTLLFLRQKETVHQQAVTLKYVSLRDLPGAAPVHGPDWGLQWTAKYHPTAEDKYQIFLSSGQAQNLPALAREKARFDQAQRNPSAGTGSAPGKAPAPLVAVLRPPLPGSPWYGLVVGEQQATGQVRYSFGDAQSRTLCGRLAAAGQAALRRKIENKADSSACAAFGK